MNIFIGRHCCDDQGITVGVMNEVSITITEGDVIPFPLEVFYRSFVQVVDINEWPLSRFSGIAVLGPMHLSCKIGFAKDSPDLP